MNPPLRGESDRVGVFAALVDGTIDAIATDHAPHAPETKAVPFEEAPPGMLGVETSLAVALTQLVAPGHLSMQGLLARMSWQPAAIAGFGDVQGRPIEVGEPANITVIDPNVQWERAVAESASKSRNDPWEGEKLTGRVRHTILHGIPTVINREPQR